MAIILFPLFSLFSRHKPQDMGLLPDGINLSEKENLGGFLSDKIGREKAFTLGCCALIVGLAVLLLLKKDFYRWVPYLYAVSGFGIGIGGPVLAAAIADIFYGKNFGSINGFMPLGFGLGGIIGPWFGGFVFGTTKSYSIALITAIMVVCMACIFLWIAAPRKIRKLGEEKT